MSTENTPESSTSTESKKRQMTFSVLEDGSVRADFPDSGLESFSFAPTAIPEGLYPDALTEGVISRLRGHMGRLTGENRTAENLRAALVKGWETIAGGTWRMERESGGAGTTFSIEVEAAWIFRQKRAVSLGQTAESIGTLEESSVAFAALSDEQKEKLKAVPMYKAAYAEVKARRAAENAAKLAKKAEDSGEAAFF